MIAEGHADAAVSSAEIVSALRARRYRYRDEIDFQDMLSEALTECGIGHEREVQILGGRIDFLVGAVGMEVKVTGSVAATCRQLIRYSAAEEVAGLLLVTTCATHQQIPRRIGGKPLQVLVLGGMSL